MKQLSILITLLIVSSLALNGKVYPALKVKGNYKELRVLVENVGDNEAGLTRNSVENKVKLRLLANGIKPVSGYQPHYLYVNVMILPDGNAYAVRLNLQKYSSDYGVDMDVAGISYDPQQGSYIMLGTAARSASFILDHVEQLVDIFLLDYIESNME